MWPLKLILKRSCFFSVIIWSRNCGNTWISWATRKSLRKYRSTIIWRYWAKRFPLRISCPAYGRWHPVSFWQVTDPQCLLFDWFRTWLISVHCTVCTQSTGTVCWCIECQNIEGVSDWYRKPIYFHLAEREAQLELGTNTFYIFFLWFDADLVTYCPHDTSCLSNQLLTRKCERATHTSISHKREITDHVTHVINLSHGKLVVSRKSYRKLS